jgi:very-short-patch-repair endonuclease
MRPIPAELAAGPFTRTAARQLGVTDRQLDGARFARVFPGVYRLSSHEMSESDWVAAAGLALPDDARITGLTRIRALGLDYGPTRPLRFVVARDHHVALDGVFLHRTRRLPPTDAVGVVVEAAYVAYCARARVLDAVKVGDWLLNRGHMTVESLNALAVADRWRDGAREALWVTDHLDGACRSLPESETRLVLAFAGLPKAEVNTQVDVGEDVVVLGDLVFAEWGTVVEYEGGHHQRDRDQYVKDLDRYELLRGAGQRYVQVTRERLSHPRTLVGRVYRELLAAGYAGPPPECGDRWNQLFQPVSTVVGPRGHRRDRVAS